MDADLTVGFVQEQRSEKSLEALNKVRLPVCRERSELADHGSLYLITATLSGKSQPLLTSSGPKLIPQQLSTDLPASKHPPPR
jgi:hypothetical protein